ncbi:hypothetical protein ACFVYA_31670 [Amycolatopsis sp. NPDC058278]
MTWMEDRLGESSQIRKQLPLADPSGNGSAMPPSVSARTTRRERR